MLRLGFRNIVISPNKGWTWSNPSVDLLLLCSFPQMNAMKCMDIYHATLERFACKDTQVKKYEDRVQSMAKDFHIHQNQWKRYMKIFFAVL